jgi:hypothetical protein
MDKNLREVGSEEISGVLREQDKRICDEDILRDVDNYCVEAPSVCIEESKVDGHESGIKALSPHRKLSVQKKSGRRGRKSKLVPYRSDEDEPDEQTFRQFPLRNLASRDGENSFGPVLRSKEKNGRGKKIGKTGPPVRKGNAS